MFHFELPSGRRGPCTGGGSLQRAIKADLETVCTEMFLDRLSKADNDSSLAATAAVGPSNRDRSPRAVDSPGSGFAQFKLVYQSAKLGLLNRPGKSGFFPEKSLNESAYSQLLYATCLDLLRDALQLHNSCGPTCLQKCAFALFTLYTFFQTNPLSTLFSQQQAEPDAAVPTIPEAYYPPMDLNSKRQQRRYSAPLIRVDMEHYTYMLQVVEMARSTLAKTPTTSALHLLSQDVIAIVQRMLQEPSMLDLCSYTGPCGLDAWALHANRPLPPNARAVAVASTEGVAVAPDQQEVRPDAAAENSCEGEEASAVEPCWNEYYEKTRAAIRLPPPNGTRQSNRIRETLQQVFQDPKPRPPWREPYLDTEPKQTKEAAPASKQDAWLNQIREQNVPDGLTSLQQTSIIDALQSLYERNVPLFALPPDQERVGEAAHQGDANTAAVIVGRATLQDHFPRGHRQLGTNRKNDRGEVSTPPADDVTCGTSVAGTSVGRKALRHLLKRARETTDGVEEHFIGAVDEGEPPPRAARQTPNRHKRARVAARDKVAGEERADSQVDDESAVTRMTTASVGRKALGDLLKRAREASNPLGDTVDQVAGATSDEESSAGHRTRRAKRARREARNRSGGEEQSAADIDDDKSAITRNTTASVGKKALSDLIKQARGSSRSERNDKIDQGMAGADSDDESTPAKVAAFAGRTRRSVRLKRTRNTNQAKNDVEPAVVDDGETIASASVGRKALSDLLKQAGSPDGRKVRQAEGYRLDEKAIDDTSISNVATAGVGRNTMGDLLKRAPLPDDATRAGTAGEASVATSIGRRAIGDLLKRARIDRNSQPQRRTDFLEARQENLQQEKPLRRKREQELRTSVEEEGDVIDLMNDDMSELSFGETVGNGQDDHSIATASQIGKMALGNLLRHSRK